MTLRGARSSLIWTLTCCGIGIAASATWLVRRVPEPWSVVVITLDTTRADRLSPYGLMDVSMPALDRLAREGVVFDRATSVAPLTLPAHASLFTGLFPPAHGVHDNASPPLAEAHVTLAEVLRARGRRTAAFVATAVLDGDRGLAQGFERYEGVATSRRAGSPGSPLVAAHGRQRRGDEVITDAIQWLDGIDEAPFFLWAHLYDAHRPYDPPQPFRSRHSDPYVGEIAFMDAQIGRLLEALEVRGQLERTVMVVVGDHGESLGDHGEDDHGIFVYESVLRVPLIVRAPGLAPRRVGAVVRLPDLMPTILALASPAPVAGPEGVSLLGLLTGEVTDLGLEAYAESEYPERMGWSPLRSLSDGRYKVIDAPRPELYDLHRDPFEVHDIYRERPALGALMTSRVRTLARPTTPAHRAAAPPADLIARLAALGYVGTAGPTDQAERTARPDPKDCIGEMNARSHRAASPAPLGESSTCRH